MPRRSPILPALLLTACTAASPALAEAPWTEEERRTISVFEDAAPSAVFVAQARVYRKRFRRTALLLPSGVGSGLLWDAQGHVVTNFHVVDRGDAFAVMLYDTSMLEARLVGVDPATDLAVLRLVDPPDGLRPVVLPGEEAPPRVGQRALAIGNPHGLDHTLTVGTVSAVGREIEGYGGVSIRGMIQTDAAINQGNSGGPLLDSRGQLLGVNTMIYSRSGASSGLGFAVPTNTVRRIVPQLIAHGRVVRPQLGAALLSARVSQRAGIEGAVIERVESGSAAAEVGLEGLSLYRGRLRLGDVILAVDGTAVRSPDDVFHALDAHTSGDPIVLIVSRGGEQREIEVPLRAP